ncbi:MAG: SIR2 family protein [Phycisphaerae bacterium]|nr:SIR2 family protein [Phycisphaerae bacterium]
MGKKRVFILGAGFSKQAGLPLSTELTSLVLDGPRLKEIDDLQEWLADFKSRLADMEGTDKDFQLNIEQLMDFAEYDIELRRMWQQLCPVGRTWGETSWELAEGISAWLHYINEDIVHAIWDAQNGADLKAICKFADHLSSDDTVITFNYDTLVESALSQKKQPWNHGLNDHENGGVAVLKMHGSIDWILLERKPEDELEKFTKLFSKKDSNVEDHSAPPPKEEFEYLWELWRANDTQVLDAIMKRHETGLSHFKYIIGLAGLGRQKTLHTLPGTAQVWRNAFQALHKAHEVYVIGFSMSPYDSMARFHLTSVIHARKSPLERTVIINPSALSLKKNYHVVFGDPLVLIDKMAEDIDWGKILVHTN